MKLIAPIFRAVLAGKLALIDVLIGLACLAYGVYLYFQEMAFSGSVLFWLAGGLVGLISAFYNPTRRISEKILTHKIGKIS